MIDYSILIPTIFLFYVMLFRRMGNDMDVRHAQMRRDLARRLRHDPFMRQVRYTRWQYDLSVARAKHGFERELEIASRAGKDIDLWLN